MPGPTPGSRCQACNHTQASAIDDLLRARSRSFSAIGRSFGLAQKVISRHAQAHVAGLGPRQPRTATTATGTTEQAHSRPGNDPTATVDPGDELRAQLAELQAMETDELTPTARLNLMDSRRRTAEALSKLSPIVPSVVTVSQVDGLGEIFANIYGALQAFPEARAALRDAYRAGGIIPLKENDQ